MATATERITVERYLEITTEGDRTQLVDGRIVVNEPRFRHSLLQTRIIGALHAWATATPGRGIVTTPTDVRVGSHDLYGPDALWIAEPHLPQDPDAELPRIPDLCVEVRSPSTWQHDLGEKAMYESAGLPELWLVDSAAPSVLVYRRSAPTRERFDVELELGAGEALTSPQLPDFALALAELFAAPR